MITGDLLKPQYHLKKGQEFRLVFSSKYIGDNTFIPIDYNADVAEKISIGSKVYLDYGSVCLEVVGFEDEGKFESRLKPSHHKNRLLVDRKIVSFQINERHRGASLMEEEEEKEESEIERDYFKVKDIIREEDEFSAIPEFD